MAVFPADSVRTKNWGTETLTDSDLETQLDLLHNYIKALLDSSSGHSHDGTSNQGPKIPVNTLTIASQATGDVIYASSASAWARLAKGTSLQVLRMNVGATLPEWGDISYATVAEVKTGTEAAKVVAPSTIIGHEGVVKGWINFKGDGTSINDSYNVSGIVDNGTGSFTVTWDTDFGSTSYAVVVVAENASDANKIDCSIKNGTQAAGSIGVTTSYANNATDCAKVHVIGIGDR